MSSRTQRSDTSTSRSDSYSEQLHRLVVEAGKYLGKTSGDMLPIEELRKQASTNGYSNREIDALLEADGLTDTEVVTVPKQADAFGDLWKAQDNGSDNVVTTPQSTAQAEIKDRPATRGESSAPEPLDDPVEDCYGLHDPIADTAEEIADDRYLEDGQPMTAFEVVGSYIKRRHGENVSAEKHGFKKTRHWRAKQRYARCKEMDRQLLEEYDNPTTALFSLRISPGNRSRLTLLAGMKEAIDEAIEKVGYQLQRGPNGPFSSDEWEYFAVVAGTDGRATPHLHIMVYCDGDVSRTRFEPVVEKFVEKCPYAPDDMRGNDPKGGAIRIRGQGGDIIPRMDDAPGESAGATYVLQQLPHLEDVDEMALDELLHSSTVDAWQGQAWRKSTYTVWDDEEEPSQEEISDVTTASSADNLADLM